MGLKILPLLGLPSPTNSSPTPVEKSLTSTGDAMSDSHGGSRATAVKESSSEGLVPPRTPPKRPQFFFSWRSSSSGSFHLSPASSNATAASEEFQLEESGDTNIPSFCPPPTPTPIPTPTTSSPTSYSQSHSHQGHHHRSLSTKRLLRAATIGSFASSSARTSPPPVPPRRSSSASQVPSLARSQSTRSSLSPFTSSLRIDTTLDTHTGRRVLRSRRHHTQQGQHHKENYDHLDDPRSVVRSSRSHERSGQDWDEEVVEMSELRGLRDGGVSGGGQQSEMRERQPPKIVRRTKATFGIGDDDEYDWKVQVEEEVIVRDGEGTRSELDLARQEGGHPSQTKHSDSEATNSSPFDSHTPATTPVTFQPQLPTSSPHPSSYTHYYASPTSSPTATSFSTATLALSSGPHPIIQPSLSKNRKNVPRPLSQPYMNPLLSQEHLLGSGFKRSSLPPRFQFHFDNQSQPSLIESPQNFSYPSSLVMARGIFVDSTNRRRSLEGHFLPSERPHDFEEKGAHSSLTGLEFEGGRRNSWSGVSLSSSSGWKRSGRTSWSSGGCGSEGDWEWRERNRGVLKVANPDEVCGRLS